MSDRSRGVRVRTALWWVTLAVGIAVAACAGGPPPGRLAPEELAALEAEHARKPGDPALNLRLARAYYHAQRHAEARRALAVTLLAQPENREAAAWLGLVHEELAQFDSARAIYTRLLSGKPNARVQHMLDGRLSILARKELQAAARQTLAREAELSRQAPEPNTVAVMQFRYTGRDSTLRPLERGLAALVISDLSRVARLRVVERDRIQALLDELKLAESGRTDPQTGARSGRLLRASQVVQGQFQEVPTAAFRIDASVVRASDAQVAATGSDADRFNALFDMEKRVVFQLLERLGITLTPGERQAISERATQDIQAFLLYSRGLEAQDRGDFRAAAAAFDAAAKRDPGFGAAAQQAQTSQAASDAATAPPTEVATTMAGGLPTTGGGPSGAPPTVSTLTNAINTAVPSGVSTIETVTSTSVLSLPPTQPNPTCESGTTCGPQNPILRGNIIIIVRRP